MNGKHKGRTFPSCWIHFRIWLKTLHQKLYCEATFKDINTQDVKIHLGYVHICIISGFLFCHRQRKPKLNEVPDPLNDGY